MSIDLDHLPELIGPIARELLGEPNRAMSSKLELRFGSHGSLSVDLAKGTFFDHEQGQGGGVLDFITRELALTGAARENWIGERFPDAIKPNGSRSNGKSTTSRQVATYDYVDEAGNLLFQQVRFEPKTFRQRRRDERGDWLWSVRGVRQVPYHLPELIETVAEGHIVFIAEGEKDVDNLRKLGVPATCNAGGAGKWPESLTEFFRDADVVVIADNDPQARKPDGSPRFHDSGAPVYPGQDHARAVCACLSGVAANVRLLDLKAAWPECPPKGDASDFIAAGGTAEQLYEIAEGLPRWTPDMPGPEPESLAPKLSEMDLPALEGQPVPRRRWAVRNRIPACNITLLSGEGGVGKSLLMQQLAVATVLGREWIGELPEPGPVLVISAEDAEDEIHHRMAGIVSNYGARFADLGELHIISLAGKDAVLASAQNHGLIKPTPLFESICTLARKIRPKWIGLDTAADVFVIEERDRSQVRQCISLLRGLALEIDAAILLLTHPSLSGISRGDGQSGSTAWNNSVRSRLYLRSPREDKEDDDGSEADIRILETMKANYAAAGEQVRLQWKEGLLVIEGKGLPAAPYDKASAEANAERMFLEFVSRFEREDRPISANAAARNYAPGVFSRLEESKPLNRRPGTRRRLFENAMESLFKANRIATGMGPKKKPPSKQTQIIVCTGTLL